MTPGEYRARGRGLEIAYGFHPSPFGDALVMMTSRGLAGLAFADGEAEHQTVLEDMAARWPAAAYRQDPARTGQAAARIFDFHRWRADSPMNLVMIGTDFEIRVWRMLLRIPVGKATTYGDIASRLGAPKAARAVGSAVGRNPLSFVVPCHRVIGKSGALTGYHWGLNRKRAILGWEAGLAARAGEGARG
jgi:AraC family transcriptional regulator of adaptative response/methylated-DNA-[protein]-cysteine methyltransferase